jgi:hypothetical protein
MDVSEEYFCLQLLWHAYHVFFQNTQLDEKKISGISDASSLLH